MRLSRWEDLLIQAYKIIDFINQDHDLLTSWTFGGGTAMMLQINHRESYDVDLFLSDPQLLPYFLAAVREMEFEIGTPAYGGDGTSHLKVAFEQIGEIDFIVASPVLETSTQTIELLGRPVQLETVPEIIAKKIRYRGSSIQPRDVFDIAAASDAGYESAIRSALTRIPGYRDKAADHLDRLRDEYVNTVIAQLILKPEFEATAKKAIKVARRLLQA